MERDGESLTNLGSNSSPFPEANSAADVGPLGEAQLSAHTKQQLSQQ